MEVNDFTFDIFLRLHNRLYQNHYLLSLLITYIYIYIYIENTLKKFFKKRKEILISISFNAKSQKNDIITFLRRNVVPSPKSCLNFVIY